VKLPKFLDVRLLLNGLYSIVGRYRRLSEVKHQLVSLPIKLKNGHWHIDGGLFWQSADDKKEVERLFYLFYPQKQPFARSWRSQFVRWVFRSLAVSSFRVTTGSVSGPSVIFNSRGGSLKLFDFDSREVITVISGQTADNLTQAMAVPIFDFFSTNAFTIDQSFRQERNLCVKREALIDVPCMAMDSVPIQIQSMKKMCTTYIEYARQHASPPAPHLFESCFDEVVQCLTEEARVQCLMMRNQYLAFVHSANTVAAHLDFNVANFINGDCLLLLDIEDAGLRLPLTYDMNNLLLNEAYYDRSMHLLMEVLKDKDTSGYTDLLKLATGVTAKNQLKVSLFVNYILRESRYVSERLIKHWDAHQAQRNWDRLLQHVPGWPFIEDEMPPAHKDRRLLD
jgi:hypothetical protein